VAPEGCGPTAPHIAHRTWRSQVFDEKRSPFNTVDGIIDATV
jgi:hypothetical protein